jgi:hypothetical protein
MTRVGFVGLWRAWRATGTCDQPQKVKNPTLKIEGMTGTRKTSFTAE